MGKARKPQDKQSDVNKIISTIVFKGLTKDTIFLKTGNALLGDFLLLAAELRLGASELRLVELEHVAALVELVALVLNENRTNQ